VATVVARYVRALVKELVLAAARYIVHVDCTGAAPESLNRRCGLCGNSKTCACTDRSCIRKAVIAYRSPRRLSTGAHFEAATRCSAARQAVRPPVDGVARR